MIKIYVIAIVLITIFYTSTFFYRKKLRKNLNRKDYPLKALFGMAMFMVDKFHIAYAGKGNSLNKAIRKISVKEDIKKEKIFVYCKQGFLLHFMWYFGGGVGIGNRNIR